LRTAAKRKKTVAKVLKKAIAAKSVLGVSELRFLNLCTVIVKPYISVIQKVALLLYLCVLTNKTVPSEILL
jgi:hypothetical protein